MKRKSTPLIDEHLRSMEGLQQATTDDFFYTRLKARMESKNEVQGWNFPLKPVWVISSLVLLLTVNGLMLARKFNANEPTATEASSSLQGFAASYDQIVNSSY